MLPHKHYSAPEIEQVLNKHENPANPPHECGAEESTLRRWKLEFPEILIALAFHLYSLTGVAMSLLSTKGPLQRLYDALESLVRPPPDQSRLAWAFFVSQSNPVHL